VHGWKGGGRREGKRCLPERIIRILLELCLWLALCGKAFVDSGIVLRYIVICRYFEMSHAIRENLDARNAHTLYTAQTWPRRDAKNEFPIRPSVRAK
jgi:hypothetical protein